MNYDELWSGGVKLLHSPDAFKLGTDAVLLSAFADYTGVKKMCDLGTGSGVIALLAAFEHPSLSADGIEIQPQSARLAAENIALNSLTDRVKVIVGDLRQPKSIGNAGAYDLTIANPPYFPAGSGLHAKSETLVNAREENLLTLQELCTAAAFFTRWGGKFCLVHRPERLSEVLTAMTRSGLEPKRLRFVKDTPSAPPNLILVEGRRGGSPGLTIEKDLIIRNPDLTETEEVRQIYHR